MAIVLYTGFIKKKKTVLLISSIFRLHFQVSLIAIKAFLNLDQLNQVSPNAFVFWFLFASLSVRFPRYITHVDKYALKNFFLLPDTR